MRKIIIVTDSLPGHYVLFSVLRDKAFQPEPRRRQSASPPSPPGGGAWLGEGARLRAQRVPAGPGLAALLQPCYLTLAMAPWSTEKDLPGSGGLFRHSCCCPRRVRSPNGQPGCRGRWFRSEPPREVTSPIRPQNLSVGLFTAAVLCARAPIGTGCADLPSGPALRADPCVKETKRHGALTYRQYIRTIARQQAVSPAVSLPAA